MSRKPKRIEKAQAKFNAAQRRLNEAKGTDKEQGARMSHLMAVRNLHRAHSIHNSVPEWLNELHKRLEGNLKKNSRKSTSNPDFYNSKPWRAVRYKALVKFGRKCMCCGATPSNGVIMHVDHIKPRSKHPDLELDLENLQILCEQCNIGKSNTDDTDFRTHEDVDELRKRIAEQDAYIEELHDQIAMLESPL